MSPRKKASLRWLISLFAIGTAVFVYVTPPGYRLRVVVAAAILAPYSLWTFFHVMRKE